MFKWIKRRRYHASVWASVHAILPKLSRARYPGSVAAINENFVDGARPEELAIQIAAAVLSEQIESTLPQKRRTLVLDQLKRFAEVRDTPQEDALTARIRRAEWMAQGWVDSGRIKKQTRDFMMSEIIGALAGQSSGERHRRRLSEIIDASLFPAARRLGEM